MVERIEKVKAEYWEVAATTETKEEKKRQEKQPGQESKDSFGETSDFVQLLAKDPRKFSSEKIASTQIKGFTFRGISTHRDKSLIEVDISMSNGTLIKGAQVAVSRQEGMRYISRHPGENLVVDQIVKGTFLTVAVPKKEIKKVTPEIRSPTTAPPGPAIKPKGMLSWSYVLGIGAIILATLMLIIIFF